MSQKGSLYVTRPALNAYVAERSELVESAGAVFELLARGTLRATVGQKYTLRDAAHAHADLESRRTFGATVLLP